jgi:hypothetical protein
MMLADIRPAAATALGGPGDFRELASFSVESGSMIPSVEPGWNGDGFLPRGF